MGLNMPIEEMELRLLELQMKLQDYERYMKELTHEETFFLDRQNNSSRINRDNVALVGDFMSAINYDGLENKLASGINGITADNQFSKSNMLNELDDSKFNIRRQIRYIEDEIEDLKRMIDLKKQGRMF